MYRGRLKRDLDDWAQRGLIDAPLAERLLADHDQRAGGFSLGSVLGMLAATLIAASILMLVAANWDAIPRLVKLGGIIAMIWIFNLGGWLARAREAKRIAAACLVLGSASFGAGIALVGQMYHLSGDNFTALLVWLSVTFVSALLFGSAALSAVTGLLAIAAFWAGLEDVGYTTAAQGMWAYWPPVVAAGVGWLCVWTSAGRAKHLAWLLLLQWVWWFWLIDGEIWMAAGVATVSVAIFLLLAVPQSPLSALRNRFGPSGTFYPLVLALSALGTLHVNTSGPLPTAVIAIAVLGLCLAAVIVEGRGNGAVRYLAYGVFAAEVLYLSYETIDSILGTSAFFLLAGLFVAVIAFIVVRLEKRFGAKSAGGVA
ncbi:DUF2157 domain-containing protein [Rhizobium sp. G187]|uniref:DUF2157 domain-containing protein n=1 Tax=unclassified Rhizobium TaxID=2613769 RepID=UPI0006B951F2|nr:DUF2157 domain-containing protein [Rhizobium sp. AAP43]KPF41743.1 hypothetical protein IP76_19560 [Rhizobium sp. AAP43]